MASFRILNQAPQYFLEDGTVNSGGKLYFYEADLTTPKDTWSDEAMTVLNSNPVVMDSAGRSLTDIWGDGVYGVVMTDSADVEIWTRNDVQAGGDPAQTIPALVNGEFLTNDGVAMFWASILQVPDPTGLSNFYLTSDGTAVPVWTQIPEPVDPPDPEIVVETNSFRAGVSDDPTKFFFQSGDATAPATGLVNTSASVTFATAFSTTPKVMVIPSSDSNAGGPMVAELTAKSTTGFTVLFTIAAGNLSSAVVLNAVPFDWVAFGTIEVP